MCEREKQFIAQISNIAINHLNHLLSTCHFWKQKQNPVGEGGTKHTKAQSWIHNKRVGINQNKSVLLWVAHDNISKYALIIPPSSSLYPRLIICIIKTLQKSSKCHHCPHLRLRKKWPNHFKTHPTHIIYVNLEQNLSSKPTQPVHLFRVLQQPSQCSFTHCENFNKG